MARPTKLTPAVEELILDALRKGNTRTAAAEYVGIPRETLSRWMARSVTFRHAVTRAEAEAEVHAVDALRDGYDDGDWRAALAWLERRRHDDWGRRDRLDLVATIRILAREHGLTGDEEREAVAEAMRVMRESAHEQR